MTAGPVVALTVEQLWQPVPGGSGRYVVELTRALLDRGDVAPVGLVARHPGPPPAAWAPDERLPLASSLLPRRALYEAWRRTRRPRTWRRVAGTDLVHATTWAVPPAGPPLVVTVHDVAFRHDPGHFTPHGVAYFERGLDIVRREATAVIAVSRTTADDVVAAGVAAARVHVVPNGVSVPRVPAGDVVAFRARHGLERPYVLWVGTVEPRKNVGTLLAAFARLVAPGTDAGLDLVLVGPTGWGAAPAEVEARLRDLPAERVHRLGALDTADLHRAYAGAHAFAFPSVREGFGLPVLEAMAHGVPVVTSAGTAMAEVAGDGALLVEPHDDAALAGALRQAVGDAHDDLVVRGRAVAAEYSWRRSAQGTRDVYSWALARGPRQLSGTT